MFGKTKDTADIDTAPGADIIIDDFFGDEAAAAEAVRIDNLHQRLSGVEQQINSQFTSMAAYAQIAQEQVELVRSEAQHANERSEQRVIGLIERERSDRLDAPAGSSPDLMSRIDALEVQVSDMREAIHQCLSNQKALADAITDLFAQPAAVAVPAPDIEAPVADIAIAEDTPTDEAVAEEVAPEDAAADEAVAEDVTLEPAPVTPLLGTDDFMGHDAAPQPYIPVEEDDLFPEYTSPALDADLDDGLDDAVEITTHDDDLDASPIGGFDVFAAPDIATIEPMTSLPAPVLGHEVQPHTDMPAPDQADGPIAALSLD